MVEKVIRRVVFDNGLTIEFSDRSNRYFGDYHRLLIEIDALIETDAEVVRLRYQRPLKRMGVAGADVADEMNTMIEQFLATTAFYMRQSGFVQKLLESAHHPRQQIWKRLG